MLFLMMSNCLQLVNFLKSAGEITLNRREKLFLVGGIVRDLLLQKTNIDIDLVVEGNAIELAKQLTSRFEGRLTTHPPFGTAKLQWDRWSIDLATARTETYARPGTLPAVTPGTIEQDLFRRDFTINAMAIELMPERYGTLLDLHGGRDDLENKHIRILHDKSFIDDATRIWRGIRYEQRLDFQIEPHTLALLTRDVPMLDTISGERIRYELECVLNEDFPEKILRRADEMGVLARLNPSLKGNDWLVKKFQQARQASAPDVPLSELYLALLTHHLTEEEKDQFTSKLRLTKLLTKTLT